MTSTVIENENLPGGADAAAYGHVRQEGVDTSHGPILYLDDISVSFDGFKALNKLTLTIEAGELRVIIGPNGAGKTTMMDVITGKTRPDSGDVLFGGSTDLTKLDEATIAELGIGRKFQKPTVFESHTVDDNILLALKAPRSALGGWAGKCGVTEWKSLSSPTSSRWAGSIASRSRAS